MRKPVFVIMAVLLGIAAAAYLSGVERLPVIAGSILFAMALGTSFVRGTDALYIIVFAMLFSPEIGAALNTGRATGEGSSVSVRLEDLLLVAVGVGWLLRTAYQRRHFGIIRTRLNAPIMLFMAVAIVATLMGILRGSVSVLPGIFNNLKMFEYFFIFLMILAHVRDQKTIKGVVTAMLVVFFMALVYGYIQIGTGARVTAPFDREPNTFGGYIVLMMCVCLGGILTQPRAKSSVFLMGLLLFAVPPLLFTLSRASYMALLAGVGGFLLLSRYRLIAGTLLIALLSALVLGAPLLPVKAVDRVTSTFQRGTQYHVQIAGVDFDPSASARLVSYRQAVDKWVQRPLLGYGVTGTHFIDGQFFRILAETGILGLSAFLFLIWRLISSVYRAYASLNDRFVRGVAMGLFCGIIAILGHSMSANSFIIIRIAEPLWVLVGLILIARHVELFPPQDPDQEKSPHTFPPASPPAGLSRTDGTPVSASVLGTIKIGLVTARSGVCPSTSAR